MTTTSPAPPAAAQKSSVNDILGLFDSTPSTTAPTASLTSPVMGQQPSAFSLVQTQPAQSPPQPAAPRLTSYPAYDRNGLKITLTPQTSAAKPGVVNILARFQVTGGDAATGINFQAAVPKVCYE